MRARLLVGTMLVLVAVGVVAVLSSQAVRRTGTNGVLTQGFAVEVPAGATACQSGVPIWDDSGKVQLLVGTYTRPVPRMTVRFTDERGALVAQGGRSAGGAEGTVTLPLADDVDGNRTTRMCIHNGGGTRIVLGGDTAAPANAAIVGRRRSGGVIAATYLESRPESWWTIAPDIARRFGLGKASLFGTWTLPVVVVALLALWAATVRLLLRETSR